MKDIPFDAKSTDIKSGLRNENLGLGGNAIFGLEVPFDLTVQAHSSMPGKYWLLL